MAETSNSLRDTFAQLLARVTQPRPPPDETVAYRTPYGNITQGDIDTATAVGMSVSGGGLSTRLPKRVTGPVESHPDYIYHATSADRLHDIAEEGLRLHQPHEFTAQDVWPDGSVHPRNYFTPTAQNTWQFAPEEGSPALLRLLRAQHPVQPERGTGDLYSRKDVPKDLLEYLHESGDWKKL